jgi:hypothetical protein
MFADLFTEVGRRSVPPMIVAVVMVLQRIEGCSDREAVDRFAFDARWKYAAGGLDFDYPGFVHTVLVDMRARLGRSQRPDRIFEVTLEVAKAAGLVGRKRVLDSTPLYDAVATMDTVTLIRSAIRGLLKVVEADLERELRGRLCGGDDYASCGKPVCDYDDPAARQALVDALAGDAMALLDALDGRELDAGVSRAAQLLATVVGQDLDCDGRRGSPRSRSLDARFVTVLQVPQGPCLPTLMGGEDALRLKNWDAKTPRTWRRRPSRATPSRCRRPERARPTRAGNGPACSPG